MSRNGDTAPRIAALQVDALRKMTGVQRLHAALEMSVLARELARSGIRRRHPEWDERQVSREIIRRAFDGAEIPRGAW